MARGKVVQMEKRELAVLARGKIRPGERDEWDNEQLYILPLPPTNLRGCHLIRINYDVFVSQNIILLDNIVKFVLIVYSGTKRSTKRSQIATAHSNGHLPYKEL